MRRRALVWLVAAGCLAGAAPRAGAAVKLNPLFTDNMVLQRDMKVPVWGTAEDGTRVAVDFQGQHVAATAEHGRWRVNLNKLKAGGPFEMTVTAGDQSVQLKNVLVGEVWVCSGQSNMEWPMAATANASREVAAAQNPMIRLFHAEHRVSPTPVREIKGKWEVCGPETVKGFSAVAYFFGRDLQKTLQVPVGLIQSAWGGTIAEAWTSRGTLESTPAIKPLLDRVGTYLEAFKRAEAQPDAASQRAKFGNPNVSTVLYNGMIAPLIPYAIRGAIWYQGESNANRGEEYQTFFPAMITDWRKHWKQGDFPFLFVQLAPFAPGWNNDAESWPRLREAQLITTQKVPKTAMAVITDVGERTDIHPKRKESVGQRLALGALALAYHQKVEYSGPVYHGMKVKGNRAVLSFKHLGGGLVAAGDKLTGFTIAGADGHFVPAEATIEGDHVVVSSPQVEKPVAVRYGWANYPEVNLENKAGLPASPFRTDHFPAAPPAKKSGRKAA